MECQLKALSPTSLKCFEENVDTFVLRYVLSYPRPSQTRAMSIGSAFDARVKACLSERILGIKGLEEKLLYDQVEECNREWAFRESEAVFNDYVNAGLVDRMIREIGDSILLRFEFEQFKSLRYEDGYEVPLYGKPDAYFRRRDGLQIVIDWKVNGFCSQASPAPGYVALLDRQGYDKGPHKLAFPAYYKGILALKGELPPQWHDQLIMYTWMLGEGDDWIAGIDQLVYRNNEPRYAIHRIRILDDPKLRARIRFAWEHISSQHYYYDRPKEESDARIILLQNHDCLADLLTNR